MPPLRQQYRRLIAGTLLALLTTGCAADPAPSVPAATPGPTDHGPSAVPTDAGATPTATEPSQTDTSWGRIWDGLPEAFPRFPGASPTETGEGPASAILDVGAAPPAEVATFYQTALEGIRYTTVELSGPREDGSWEVASISDDGCAILATVTPLGGTTIVTILYGAGCSFG